jgi:beta-glucanase (GH16 family)
MIRLMRAAIPRASKTGVALATVVSLAVAGAAVGTASSASAANPSTIWGTSAPISATVDTDTSPVELGTRFTAVTGGQANGVRFYKTPENSGAHTGSLWTSTGRLLGRVAFSGETSTGWQTASFTSPIKLTAGGTYVVSYHTNVGRYVATEQFTGTSSTPSLQVPTSNVGVFTYAATSTFPKSSWHSSQYWVDLTVTSMASATTPVATATTTVTPHPTLTSTVTTPYPTTTTSMPTLASTTGAAATNATTTSTGAPTATTTKQSSSASSATTVGATPTLLQEFNPSWSGWPTSPDGNWRVAGDWTGTGGNQLLKANAALLSSYNGQSSGYLTLTSRAGRLSGGEIQTVNGAGGKYGYYEASMKVSGTPGVCDSFFWIGDGYGNGEIDVEFLTNESWISSANSGQVHFTVHAADGSELGYIVQLGFNPSQSFHRYGFLHTPNSIVFTVDGKPAWTVPGTIDMATNIAPTGYIMMNSWTGNPNWGGGPPATDAVVVYDWVKYFAGASSIPAS